MKLGSSAGRPKTTVPTSAPNHTHPDSLAVAEDDKPQGKLGTESKQNTVIPRTRDDSSDEEERPTNRPPLLENAPPPLIGHAPPHHFPHHFPGNYPHHQQQQQHPLHHMIPMRGVPQEQYYPPMHGRGPPGLHQMPPPHSTPHSVGNTGGGILPPHSMPPPSMVSDLVWV